MRCSDCQENAVMDSPTLCKVHFVSWFQEVVQQTIEKENLFSKNTMVGVAVSGGKDSMVLLSLLKRLGYKVIALSVNEGIPKYRDATLDVVRKFCKENDIILREISFKSFIGESLKQFLTHYNDVPCRACGAFRRSALNNLAKDCNVLATGHNLDDEAQTVMMNLLHNQPVLNAKIGPRVGTTILPGYVQRVKPLFWLTEKQIKAYAFVAGIPMDAATCPFQKRSFRAEVRDMLNEIIGPEGKLHIMKLALTEQARGTALVSCSSCNLPAATTMCRSCMLKQEVAL